MVYTIVSIVLWVDNFWQVWLYIWSTWCWSYNLRLCSLILFLGHFYQQYVILVAIVGKYYVLYTLDV